MKKYISYIIVILLIAASPVFAQKKKAQILVDPNIQVSTDGNFHHFESMVAANPMDPDNLIIGVTVAPILIRKPGSIENMNKIYVTKDGGKTWDDIILPEELKYGANDPQVEFGINGTAYYCSLVHKGRSSPILFYRSEDGGATWKKPFDFGNTVFYGLPKFYDHEQLVVDRTYGKYAGRIYISGDAGGVVAIPYKNKTTPYGLFRSDNDGRTFIGPAPIITQDSLLPEVIDKAYRVNSQLLISSEGTLYFTYLMWDPYPARQYEYMYLMSSKDGGITFSSPKKIPVKKRVIYQSPDIGSGIVQYAIDNQSVKYLDRLYCVYSDSINSLKGSPRIMFTYSKDGGDNWSKPEIIDNNCPDYAIQYQPAVTVNPKGVVGVRWYDTRASESGHIVDEYFTASTNGGETFLTPVKVSSESSTVPQYGDGEWTIPIWKRSLNKDFLVVFFPNNVAGWARSGSRGGDYTQFTSDARGVFHSVWSDSRDGRAYQLYTSAIRVVEPDSSSENINTETASNNSIEQNELNKLSITTTSRTKKLSKVAQLIYLEIDPTSYDSTKNILSIPVRLKNISDKAIYGPVKFEISSIDTAEGKTNVPVILNSDNKKKGDGAEYEIKDKYLGKSGVLLPGEKTKTITIKLKVGIIKKRVKLFSDEDMKRYNQEQIYKIERIGADAISSLHINVTGYLVE